MMNGTPVHMYRDCMLDAGRSGEHWLRSSWIHRGVARRVFAELWFTVRDCGSLEPGAGAPPCRETFGLYFLAAPTDLGLRFRPAQFTKIGILAGRQSFTAGDVRAGRARLNREARSFEPGAPSSSSSSSASSGLYLALRNAGACVALVRARLSYRRCPAHRRGLARFPATVCPPAGLLEVGALCPLHALALGRPRLHCGAQGGWLVAVGRCVCRAGYQESAGACRACHPGYYKELDGDAPCTACPAHSISQSENSTSCPCNGGFYRAQGESANLPCTGTPSAPRNVSVVVLGSKVTLSWLPPLDPGGREDLSYTVGCEMCPREPAHCVRCASSVTSQPAWAGLREPWVSIEGLEAFANYTFRIAARNGVSAMAQEEERGRGGELRIAVEIWESMGAPPAVAAVTVLHREETSLSVAWQPTEGRGQGIMGYEVMYQQQGHEQIYTVKKLTENKVTLTQLRPATVYLLKVRVQTPLGPGDFSPVYQFQTLPPEEKGSPNLIILSCVFGSLTVIVVLAALVWVRH
uniref:ephrin type-A receptor 1-like n=1 Tax=Pristiophorus japonicus TaxID=55135 RepID=UPI00398F8B75